MPALFTSPSMAPNRASTSATTRSLPCGFANVRLYGEEPRGIGRHEIVGRLSGA